MREEKNLALIMNIAPTMFLAIHPAAKVKSFMSKALMLEKDVESACRRLTQKIRNAPESYKTYFKNALQSLRAAHGSKRAL